MIRLIQNMDGPWAEVVQYVRRERGDPLVICVDYIWSRGASRPYMVQMWHPRGLSGGGAPCWTYVRRDTEWDSAVHVVDGYVARG
jgi:hypothetical protein